MTLPTSDTALPWSDAAVAFANRLTKRFRHLSKWARREGVTCFRVYDADIPEVPLVVDWYEGRLHVAEYVKGQPGSDDWRAELLSAAAHALEVPPARVFFKERERKQGTSQYEKVGEADVGSRFVVNEGDHRFLVNLADYVDTGLFLDHRPMRAMVGAEARSKRVLNLFAYTGAFTVYAAVAGARETTTVDMSATYLDWARENLSLNRVAVGDRHTLVQADVLQWLDDAPAGRWDQVICDPPTFSNSKRMQGVLDIQRDHADLLQRIYRVVKPGGVVWFSTNSRRFKPAPEAFVGLGRVEDITERSIPEDFRNKRIHKAWRLELATLSRSERQAPTRPSLKDDPSPSSQRGGRSGSRSPRSPRGTGSGSNGPGSTRNR